MPQKIQVDTAAIFASAMKLMTEDPRYKVGRDQIRGNDYTVFENAPNGLVELFEAGAAYGARDFILYEDEVYSFKETWQKALQFAAGLKKRFDIKPDDRVGISMQNCPEWCFSYMGIIALGAVVVPLNSWWKTQELVYAIKDSDIKVVVVDGKRYELLASVRKELDLSLVIARDPVDGNATAFDELVQPSESIEPYKDYHTDDDFSIIYTSGSTGHPKGVILTHRGCVSSIVNYTFLTDAVNASLAEGSIHGDNPGILLGVPLFHVSGSHILFLMSYFIGRRLAMMTRWDPEKAVKLINTHQITNFSGVPSQSYDLMVAAGDKGLPSMIDLSAGGAKRPASHVDQLQKKLKNVGASAGYGLSETNGLGCATASNDYYKRPDSTGRAIAPLVELEIWDEDGQRLPTGEAGEVMLRTAAAFRGYLNKPEETAQAIEPNGWFHTGDMGYVDDEGFLFIVDRIKQLIIRGGENISCLEVEERAYLHDDVAEVSVFSVPDDELEERVGMVVYSKEGKTVDPEALRTFMAEDLAHFKVPEKIWISQTSLPRLATEKIDKRTTRQTALEQTPAWSI
ncbi:MAG: class I adenylate-forming enzyme family protein [Pseudomonadota bacterium]